MLDHVAWSRDQTGYKYPALRHNFKLLAPAHLLNYSKRNSFTPNFEFLFTSLLTLPILLFFWTERKHSKTFSYDVFAKFQFRLNENILRPFQNMSVPKFRCFSSKLFHDNSKLCLSQPSSPLFTYYKLLPLESKQCPLTLASVLVCADSVDELRFRGKKDSLNE